MEKRTILVNGYAYPFISDEVLALNAPDLTYLASFSYGISKEGELTVPEDAAMVQAAEAFQTRSLMTLSAFTENGVFDSDRASMLFNSPELQDRYLEEVLENLQEKEMQGVDFDFEFIYPEDKRAYAAFVEKTAKLLNPLGYLVSVALAPKTSTDQPGLLYEGHDYAALGGAANLALIMTYEWGYTYGPPMAVAPLNKVREVLAYGVSQIPSEKILMGIPNYGYDWTLPYVRGESKARKITNDEALALAAAYRAEILFDQVAMSPYFFYYDEEGRSHEVWFENAESLRAKYALIGEFGLAGLSYWNSMSYYAPNAAVLKEMFRIEKI